MCSQGKEMIANNWGIWSQSFVQEVFNNLNVHLTCEPNKCYFVIILSLFTCMLGGREGKTERVSEPATSWQGIMS
jgi:hypothetical protein